MTTDRDTAHRVGSWLKEDRHEDGNRILSAVLDQLDDTPQRRSWRAAWRLLLMNNTFRLGLAAASLVVVAIVGLTLFTGRNVAAPQPTPSPSPTATPASAAAGTLEPGPYLLADNFPNITFTIPGAGWEEWGPSTSDGAGVLKECEPPGENPCVGFGFWYVANIYADPCLFTSGRLDPPVGPSVEDLAEALASRPRPSVSDPRDITLAGYSGKFLEIKFPGGPDRLEAFAGDEECRSPRLARLWVSPDGGARDVIGPGMHDRVWILDVNGTRLLVNAVTTPQTSAQDRTELYQIIESIEIPPPD
jgi:hypothetical protein